MIKKLLILALFVLVCIGGWWLYNNKYPLTPKSNVPLQKVSLRLKWLHQAQFAGNYVAIEKGFYQEAGLSVSLVPFTFDESTIDSVVSGKADFGIAGADEVIVARSLGKPVKAIAVIYKINPGVFFTKKNSGITKPQDFVGKRIGIQQGPNVEYLYRAMMSKLKIDRRKVIEVPVGYDYSELLSDKVDASVGYIINRPETSNNIVPEMNTILMADYGVNMYADVLFTTEKTISENSKIVEAMVSGTISGWKYAIENQNEANGITLKYVKDSTVKHQENMLAMSAHLINTGTGKLGWMEQSEWEQAHNILFDQKILSKKIIIEDVFTNQFLQTIYKK